jgi:hypothetical protein
MGGWHELMACASQGVSHRKAGKSTEPLSFDNFLKVVKAAPLSMLSWLSGICFFIGSKTILF